MPATDLSAIYTALDEAGRNRTAQETQGKAFNSEVRAEKQNKPMGAADPLKGKVYYSLESEQQQRENTLQMYQDYQKNIRISEQHIAEIIKGIQQGASPCGLLLKAIETIGFMVGDPQLYIESKKNLQTIHGALGYGDFVSQELQEVETRIAKLESACKNNQDQGSSARINRAIEAHKQKAKNLRTQIQQGVSVA